jgi:transcriptional regulator GlxA family with amidase domain
MARNAHSSRTRRVVIFAPPGAFSLDVLGSFEIFHAAARLLALRKAKPPFAIKDATVFDGQELAYEVELAGTRKGKLDSLSGAGLFATSSIASVHAPIDTLIVAGGDITRMLRALDEQPEIKTALRRLAKRARRVASICTGSFVLASLGLLDGKRATTHWAACDLLQARHPAIRVEREPIFTREDNLYTSAGATTGMDLCLALVRDDHGSEISREVARWLVLYVERPASQPQLSASLRAQAADHKPLRDLQLWIAEHPDADLSVTALAARVSMSVRNFARAFKRELSETPATYVAGVRVETAIRKLELGTASIEEVASQVGFGSVDALRRAFVRKTGRSPSALRQAAAGSAATPEAREARTLRLVGRETGTGTR